MPDGAIVGTSSLRREAQLMALNAGLKIRLLRGNVETRLAKLDRGEYDAIILAAAGLTRLGLGARGAYDAHDQAGERERREPAHQRAPGGAGAPGGRAGGGEGST